MQFFNPLSRLDFRFQQLSETEDESSNKYKWIFTRRRRKIIISFVIDDAPCLFYLDLDEQKQMPLHVRVTLGVKFNSI